MTRSVRLVVVVAMLAMVLSSCATGRPADAAHVDASATVTLVACPAAVPHAQTQLPAVRLHCLDGGTVVGLNRLPGRPTLVNLWASWCVACQREAARLTAAAAAYQGQVAFLGIDTEDRPQAAMDFLRRFGARYPQLSDPTGDVLHRLGAPGLPVTVVLDATGAVVYRRLGEVSGPQLSAALHAADPELTAGPAGDAGGG